MMFLSLPTLTAATVHNSYRDNEKVMELRNSITGSTTDYAEFFVAKARLKSNTVVDDDHGLPLVEEVISSERSSLDGEQEFANPPE